MNSDITVSACLITYNHEGFIEQALEGALAQNLNCNYEIIIGDDCSTDGTAEICRKYQEKYPDLIKYYRHPKNLGIVGNWNETLKLCSGKYIAICECDDFWTDELKLQKQVDFLENNLDYSACAHQSEIIFEDRPELSGRTFKTDVKETLGTGDLIHNRHFHTASILFRGEIVKQHPFPSDITSADRALFLLMAAFGKIHYSEEAMCCYRKNSGGASSYIKSAMLLKDLNTTPWIKSLNKQFPSHEFNRHIYFTAMRYPKKLRKGEALHNLSGYIYHSLFGLPKNLMPIARFVKNDFPEIWKKTSSQ